MMRLTIRDLYQQYLEQRPISMVTCYDYSFARLVAQTPVDVILVGDSLGNVIQGHDTTLPVTLDDIIYHTKSVVRGTTGQHIIADLPFMSYQADPYDALLHAGRLLKEGHAQSVKLEGGGAMVPLVRKMVQAGIPVCGHLGLTPQSVHAMGGYRVQARQDGAAKQLLEDALALQDAGAYMIVLEVIPANLAAKVTKALEIPTIGIGAGSQTSGQVLVLQDMLGMNLDKVPKFVKQFADLSTVVQNALTEYDHEVKAGSFPGPSHGYK